jgi:hypothetical protein
MRFILNHLLPITAEKDSSEIRQDSRLGYDTYCTEDRAILRVGGTINVEVTTFKRFVYDTNMIFPIFRPNAM